MTVSSHILFGTHQRLDLCADYRIMLKTGLEIHGIEKLTEFNWLKVRHFSEYGSNPSCYIKVDNFWTS
jgi:hypothetical protein